MKFKNKTAARIARSAAFKKKLTKPVFFIVAATPLAVLLVVGLVLGNPNSSDDVKAQANDRPNIVFIMTDDQAFHTMSDMPKVKQFVSDVGTKFTNTFASTSQCCPSRATLLTGKYAHNHGVLTNVAPSGGYEKAKAVGLENDTIATRLDNAGYVTAWMGKYLNGYNTTDIPAGWDRWYAYTKGISNPDGWYINVNGRETYNNRELRTDPEYLSWRAQQFIEARPDTDDGGSPFFMVMSPFTPHYPYFHDDEDANKFNNRQAPRTPNFNEADISDKALPMRNKPLKDPAQMDERYRDRLRGLQGVDRMVEEVVRALARGNHLDDTYIVFTSDNGYLMGHHRIEGKSYPYESSIKVPFIVRGPDVPRGETRDQLIANTDWAPTIADWAEVSLNQPDGRSITPLLTANPPEWRKRVLLEIFDNGLSPYSYKAMRTNSGNEGTLYVENSEESGNGQREYYNLWADPYQLNNAYDRISPEIQNTLADQLAPLKNCAGDGCRAAEN